MQITNRVRAIFLALIAHWCMVNLVLCATKHNVWNVLQITFYRTVHVLVPETDSLSLIGASHASRLMDWLAVLVRNTVVWPAEPIINVITMAIVYVRIQMCLSQCQGLVYVLLVRTTRYHLLLLSFPQFQLMTLSKYLLNLFRSVHLFSLRFLSITLLSNWPKSFLLKPTC